MDDVITLALRWSTLNEVAWPNEVQIARALIAAHERIRELEAKLDNLRAAERLLVRTLEPPK